MSRNGKGEFAGVSRANSFKAMPQLGNHTYFNDVNLFSKMIYSVFDKL